MKDYEDNYEEMEDNEQDEQAEGESPFQPMADSELLSYCTQEIARGIGGTVSSDNDDDISLPLDYYFGRVPALPTASRRDPNASRYISMDVMDVVEATVAEIMPVFTTEEIAFYNAENDRDEDQAVAESNLVNYVFFEECDGYTLLQNALRDSLLSRNSTVKCYWDERIDVEYETYIKIPEIALAQVTQPAGENQTVEIVEHEECEEVDEMTGEVYNLYTVKVKKMTKIGKPVVEAVPPEQVIISGDHTTPVLFDARFVAHEKLETQSSLIEQGYDPKIVKELTDYNTDMQDLARSRLPEEHDYYSSEESTRQIRVFECYPLIDFDGDGIAERRKVVISSNRLLSNDEWKTVPLIGGTTHLVSHKYKGVSQYDRTYQIQDAKTPVMRSIIDGTRLAANPRVGVVEGQVNIDDVLTSRTGGVVRTKSIGAIYEVPKGEIPQSAYSFLQLMDQARSERGGSAVTSASTAQKLSNDSAHSFERTMSAMELSNALLARTFGETLIRGIFQQMHQIIRENYKGELSAKLGGRWVTSVPQEWIKRTKVTVSIGASNAERARQVGMLEKIGTVQTQLAQSGSVMYSEAKAYKAITRAITLGGIKNPEQYFVDPASDEGQQASQQKQQAAQAEAEKQAATEAEMIKAQTMLGEAEMIKSQAQMQANSIRFENEQLKSEITEMKTLLDAKNKSDELQFKYDEMAVSEGLKLTELELGFRPPASEISDQHEENKDIIE